MKTTYLINGLITALLSLSVASIAMAHGDAKQPEDHHANMPEPPPHEKHGHQHEGHQAHRHDNWVDPPAEYAGLHWHWWDDEAAAKRGEELYRQNCAACHGEVGRGDGPVGVSLAHKPADLTHHFHHAPGQGDDYLFWRISEGGTVEPFRSQNSAMPAFKSVLTEVERWQILTYIHQRAHNGFRQASDDSLRKVSDEQASPVNGRPVPHEKKQPNSDAHKH